MTGLCIALACLGIVLGCLGIILGSARPRKRVNEMTSEEMVNEMLGKYVLVRSRAGIFTGTLKGLSGQVGTLENSRRLIYWDGAATISELSQKGVSRSENCRFPAEIPHEWIPEILEIMICSPEAEKSIKEVKVWTEH